MKLTYKTLGELIKCMDDEQLSCDVTVELHEQAGVFSECYPAELRVCGADHDTSTLDDGHPVLYVGSKPVADRSHDLSDYYGETGLSPKVTEPSADAGKRPDGWKCWSSMIVTASPVAMEQGEVEVAVVNKWGADWEKADKAVLQSQLSSRTYRSTLTLRDWHEIDNAMDKIRDAAKAADELLIHKLCEHTDDDTRLLLLKIDNSLDVHLPDCSPKLEWTGGESEDAKNYRLREPGIVGGCSFPAYFDEEGKPIRHE